MSPRWSRLNRLAVEKKQTCSAPPGVKCVFHEALRAAAKPIILEQAETGWTLGARLGAMERGQLFSIPY